MGNDNSEKELNALIAELDTRYEPIPEFALWSDGVEADIDVWSSELSHLKAEREQAGKGSAEAAFQKLVQAVALDTGAIEGLYDVEEGVTLSILTGVAAAEVALRNSDDNVRELFRAQLLGYEMVFDRVTGARPLNESFVRELHAAMCAPQDTFKAVAEHQGYVERVLEKGAYKSVPNHVLQPDGTYFPYCPVDEVQFEMGRLLDQLKTPEFAAAPAVLQSAYAHYAFVRIHPFQDGNGRVARALCSLWLFRDAGVPFFLLTDQRERYLQALRSADRGQKQAYADFFLDHGISAIRTGRELLTPRDPERIRRRMERIQRLSQSHGGIEHADLDKAAATLLDVTVMELDKLLAELGGSGGLSVKTSLVAMSQTTGAVVDAYRRPATSNNAVNLEITNAPPFRVSAHRRIEVQVLRPREANSGDVFLLTAQDGKEQLPIRLSEAHPRPDLGVRMRIGWWVRAIVEGALAELETNAQAALEGSNFS